MNLWITDSLRRDAEDFGVWAVPTQSDSSAKGNLTTQSDSSRKSDPTIRSVLDALFEVKDKKEDWRQLLRSRQASPMNSHPGLWHFRVNDVTSGGRVFYCPVDGRLLSIHKTRAPAMEKGDWLLVGFLPGNKHVGGRLSGERNSYACRRFIKAAFSPDLDFELHRPVNVRIEQRSAADYNRKKEINANFVRMAGRYPLPPYNEFLDYLKDIKDAGQLRPGEEQYDCLREWEDKNDNRKQCHIASLVPMFMLGFAGSGKTQLVATMLVRLHQDEEAERVRPSAYFVLSDPLRAQTEDLTCRLAATFLKDFSYFAPKADAQQAVRNAWNDALKRFNEETNTALENFDEKIEKKWLDDRFRESLTEAFSKTPWGGPVFEKLSVPKRLLSVDASFFNANRYFHETTRKGVPFRRFDKIRLPHDPTLDDFNDLIRPKDENDEFRPTFVDLPLFEAWFDLWRKRPGNQARAKDFDAVSVWTEIRGLIKGFLGTAVSVDESRVCHWGNMVLESKNFPIGTAEGRRFLLDRGLAEEITEGAKTYFVLKSHQTDWSDSDRLAASEKYRDGSDSVLRAAKNIYELAGFSSPRPIFMDERKTGLSLVEYLRLPQDVSLWGEQDRRCIYEIYKAYEEMRRNSQLQDENDLARAAAVSALNLREDQLPFDSVFVDECQDYTEMQLLAMTLLSGCRIVLAGDRHQIINPTYFSPGRVRAILRAVHGFRSRTQFELFDASSKLRTNYRSSVPVVSLANEIKNKRKQCLPSLNIEAEQPEIGINEGKPVRFLYPETVSLKQYFDAISRDAHTSFVVSGERRNGGHGLLDLVSEDRKERLAAKTYTIQQCKGLEDEKIVCFNLFSDDRKSWEKVATGRIAPSDWRRCRHAFNVLYVAVTRAQKELVLVEEDPNAFRTLAGWLNQNGRPISDSDMNDVQQDALASFRRAKAIFADWGKSESPDVELTRALHLFEEADESRKQDPGCLVSSEEIAQYIARCKAAQEIRKGNQENAALLLAAANLSNEIEETDSVVATFLKNGSFAGFDERQARMIAERMKTTAEGRTALDKAYRKDVGRMIATVKDITGLLHDNA